MEQNAEGGRMLIDCNECTMQHTSLCRDCVVSHVLSDLAGPLVLDPDQAEALDVLAEAGLVAPLQLVLRGGGEAAAG